MYLDTNLCMPTSSKRNCTISSLTFFSQYKCLSASDIKTYSNENSIGVILKSSDINNIDVSQMFVYYFSYTHYTKVKLSLTIHKVIIIYQLTKHVEWCLNRFEILRLLNWKNNFD